MTKKHCKWGKTPLDDLSHEELLRVAQRLYAAAVAARGAMGMAEIISRDPYWKDRQGAGGIALEKVKQAIKGVDGNRTEPAYDSFYRYANALLFDDTNFDTGRPWLVCDTCHNMISNVKPELDLGQPCRFGPEPCPGTYRFFTWDDFQARSHETS